MERMVDVKVPWLSLEQFYPLKGLPFPKHSQHWNSQPEQNAAKGAEGGCVLLGARNEWQTGFSALPVFQQWKIRAVPSEKSFCSLAVPRAADALSRMLKEFSVPLVVGKNVLQQSVQWRKSPSSVPCFLTLKRCQYWSESVAFCGHGLEGHPDKAKSSFCSALLDRVGSLAWDTAVGPSMWNTWGVLHFQAVKQAFYWAPDPLFCFLLCYEWLEVIEWSSVNLEFTESQNVMSWKGFTRIPESSSWVNDPYRDGNGGLGITGTNLWASEKSFG